MKMKVTETFALTAKVFYDDRYRQIVSMGGSRSSKSYSILQLLKIEMMTKVMIKITVWRDTKVTCRATVLEDFQKIIMDDPSTYKKFKHNKLSGTFTYIPTGSKIIFEGADNIGKVLGGAQDISFFNEVTEFSKDVYLQITQRTSGKVICDYNPSKDFWLEKYRYDEKSVFIHSDFRKNAFCPPNIIEQLKSYEPWVPGSYDIVNSEIYYKGQPISENNQPPPNEKNIKKGTANKYLWLVYGLGLGSEKPNRIHSGWRKISDEDFEALPYPSYYGVDFGSQNPTAIAKIKYDGDGTFYIKKVYYKPLSSVKDSIVSVLKSLGITSKDFLVCDSAKPIYINTLVDNGFQAVGAVKGNNSVSPTITVVQSFNIFYVEDEDLDNEYDNYSWRVDRYGKSTDEPVKVDDHLMDAIRYCINYLVIYLGIKI